jgi:hypothetical protein
LNGISKLGLLGVFFVHDNSARLFLVQFLLTLTATELGQRDALLHLLLHWWLLLGLLHWIKIIAHTGG